MRTPDVLVLHQGVHGLPVEEYGEALRERLPDRAVVVARTPAEERTLIERVPVVTGFDIDESLLARAERLQLFAGLYAGTDHLPMRALADRDVAVTNASGVHGPNAAEHAIGLLLALRRGIPRALRQGYRGEWRHFALGEIHGSTATVIGLGPIGEAIVDRLHAFGVETIGARYTPSKGGPADEIIGLDGAAVIDALARSDAVLLACPLTAVTEGLIDDAALAAAPPDALVINIARGPVVETDALVAAIRGNRIGGAGLDVTDPEPLPPDHPLWGFGNVIVTPHNAGFTPRYYDRVAEILAENLRRIDETGRFDGLRNQAAP